MIITISSSPDFNPYVQSELDRLGLKISHSFPDYQAFYNSEIHHNSELVLIDWATSRSKGDNASQYFKDLDEFNSIIVRFPTNEVELNKSHGPEIVPVENLAGVVYYTLKLLASKNRNTDNENRKISLSEIEMAISQPMELSEVLEKINLAVTQTLDADIGSCILLNENEPFSYKLYSTNIKGLDKNQALALMPEHYQALAQLTKSKRPIIVPNVNTSPFEKSSVVKSLNIGSGIGIPLLIQEDIIGVLFAFDHRIRNFTDEQVHFLTALANRAAIAITKVQLYQSLRDAKEIAEKAASDRADYLAHMSHELRAPLAAISNLSELLAGTALTQMQTDYLDEIKDSASRLLALLNDILDYSKIEASKLELKVKEFSIVHVIESSLNLISIPAAQKNLDLAYRIDEDVPETLVGDPNRLSQVITNLLTNAVKFTDSGYILVEVQKRADHLPLVAMIDSKVELVIQVHDTGIGIPFEDQKSLFTPFSQVDNKKVGASSGTGLGLVICKQLVKLMGGEIWVESSGIAGKGSNFKFTCQIRFVHAPKSIFLQKNPSILDGKNLIVVGKPTISMHQLLDQLAVWGIHASYLESVEMFLEEPRIDPNIHAIIIDDRGLNSVDDERLSKRLAQWRLQLNIPVITFTQPNKLIKDKLKEVTTNVIHWPLSLPRLYRVLTDAFSYKQSTTRPQLQQEIIKILLVDDDLINLKAVQLLLDRIGYQADSVSDGIGALQLLHKNPYDLVIMDMRMEMMDGQATTRAIRDTLSSTAQPMVAILTAGVTPNQLNALQSAGIDAYLEKPISISNLLNLIEMAKYKNSTEKFFGLVNEHSESLVPESNDDSAGINTNTLVNLLKMTPSVGGNSKSELLKLFNNSTSDMDNKLIKASRSMDIASIKDALHAIRGTSEIFGAERLSQLCKEAEHNADEMSPAALLDQINDVRDELLKVKNYLQAYIKDLHGH